MANLADRRSYSTPASQSAQENFTTIAGLLEALIAQRNADVNAAMAEYTATGVSEEYHAKELRWKAASEGVKEIINTLRGSLGSNDETAAGSQQRAQSAVHSIG